MCKCLPGTTRTPVRWREPPGSAGAVPAAGAGAAPHGRSEPAPAPPAPRTPRSVGALVPPPSVPARPGHAPIRPGHAPASGVRAVGGAGSGCRRRGGVEASVHPSSSSVPCPLGRSSAGQRPPTAPGGLGAHSSPAVGPGGRPLPSHTPYGRPLLNSGQHGCHPAGPARPWTGIGLIRCDFGTRFF